MAKDIIVDSEPAKKKVYPSSAVVTRTTQWRNPQEKYGENDIPFPVFLVLGFFLTLIILLCILGSGL